MTLAVVEIHSDLIGNDKVRVAEEDLRTSKLLNVKRQRQLKFSIKIFPVFNGVGMHSVR